MKRIQSLVLALGVATILSACNKNESGATNSNSATQKKLKLAFVSNTAANFWTIARAGCNDAAKELGDVEVDFRIPSTPDAAGQQQILNDLVAAGVDGVAVSVDDPDNQTAFLDKVASQTLLITTDSDAPKSKRVCYIGTDNVAAGVQAGQLIKEALPQGGKIMLFVGNVDAQNAKERSAGIKKALEGSNIQIIDTRTDDADPIRAQNNAADTLVKYPDIVCLVGLWDYNGPAILHAVRNSNMSGKVKIVCFDDLPDTLSGVASGDIYGTVVQQPYEFGKQAITRMDKYLRGDKSVLAGTDGKIFVPTIAVTKTNAAEIQAREKQLLGQ
ncbi:MAG TPA: sugar-binding protein [Verrucomicrobiae bacterium]|nr:sugar-binding protein [Verrucomicrobiae bacterium]